MFDVFTRHFVVSITLATSLLLMSCFPDFRLFNVVDIDDSDVPQEDSSTPDSSTPDGGPEDGGSEDSGPVDTGPVDTGNPDWNNPIELGADCEDPHLAIALISRSSPGSGRLLHYNISESAAPVECRESPIARQQRAFGTGVNAVTGMPDGSEVITVPYAVMGLDRHGLPRWRYQLWDYDASNYYYSEVFPLRIQGTWYVGVLHCDSYCSSSYQGLLVLDSDGEFVTHVDDLPGFSSSLPSAAPNPDGTSTIVMEVDWDPLQVFTLTPETTEIDESDGENLGGALGFTVSGIGNLYALESDLHTERFLATYNDAIVPWHPDAPMPSSGLSCSLCESFQASAIDPYDEGAIYTLCEIGNHNSLVRMTEHGCDLLVDGTSMDDFNMVDVALVRGTLD